MKKVLILGANPETVSLILKAKEMGLYTIVTDYNPDAFAKRFADQPENINAIDVEAIVSLAKKEQVDGILVGVAEALLPSYCEVCNRLGLPCYSTIDKFTLMGRKDLFKQKCIEYKVPTIREYEEGDFNNIIYPVIVKPVDSCSSKGIRVCNNRQELDSAIPYALQFSKQKRYLVEEYMVGDEVVSYYVIQDGNPIFVGMCDRYTYKGKDELVQLPTAYVFPSRYIKSYISNTDLAVKDFIRGVGLENGSIFFQCFVDSSGVVRTYEPGFRLNGAQEHIVISKVSGIDAKEMYINYALTGKVSEKPLETLANPIPTQFSCKLSPLVKLGKIATLSGLKEISQLPSVVSVNPSYSEGDIVTGEGTLKQIIVRIFIVADTKQILIDTISTINTLLVVKDEKGDNMVISDFDAEIIDKYY